MRLLEIMQLRIEHVLNLLNSLSQIMDMPFFQIMDGFFQWELFAYLITENLALHLLQQRASSSD